jgi:uncharacterized protein (TIGR02145 family)
VVDVHSTTGKTWMDRNLGATQAATSSTDALSYGDLYQWGRLSDGHQCRTSETTNILSGDDTPANGNFILVEQGESPFDWRSPQKDDLWKGVNGINNPCPSGYRLPTLPELEAEKEVFTSSGAVGAFASPLKLPAAGSRGFLYGLINLEDTHSLYWTSTVFNSTAYILRFITSKSDIMFTFSRAYGLSVRCIKN